jgi:hypothetical protein
MPSKERTKGAQRLAATADRTTIASAGQPDSLDSRTAWTAGQSAERRTGVRDRGQVERRSARDGGVIFAEREADQPLGDRIGQESGQLAADL